MSGNIHILGIGSSFADDQFGWQVVKWLENHWPETWKDQVTMATADRPGLNLLKDLEMPYRQLILIDAVNAQVPVGTTFTLKAREILEFQGFFSSHSIRVAPSLALAEVLNDPIDHVMLYGVQIQRMHQKDQIMSQTVIAKQADVSQQIQTIVTQGLAYGHSI